MKTLTLLLIGFAVALQAQSPSLSDFSNANVNPNQLYGKALDAYNKGGPVNYSEARDFYRDGGSQAIKPPTVDSYNAARKAASGNAQSIAELRRVLDRSASPNGARLPEMPKLTASPFTPAIPTTRTVKPGNITQSGDPLDLLVVQDRALSPAFRAPGSPAMKPPEISKNYNFFSGSSTPPAGSGSGRSYSGSAFGLGSSRPSGSSSLTGGSYNTPGAGASLRSSSSVISSERAAAFGSGSAAGAKGAAKK